MDANTLKQISNQVVIKYFEDKEKQKILELNKVLEVSANNGNYEILILNEFSDKIEFIRYLKAKGFFVEEVDDNYLKICWR